MLSRLLRSMKVRLECLWFRVVDAPELGACGRMTHLRPPYRLEGAEFIVMGEHTAFQRGAWLYCVPLNETTGQLRIGSKCVFGYNNHITAIQDVVIEDEVLTANNVYISDNVHTYEDIHTPIIRQPVRFKGRVTIGRGSWLGENAVILGVSVGRNCVVGANAVVTRDVPDRCIVVGAPAKIIRHYDEAVATWRLGPPKEVL